MIKTLAIMTVLITVALFWLGQAAQASPATKDQANSVFQSCVAGKPATVPEGSMMALCACYSASIMAGATAEELNLIAGETITPQAAAVKAKLFSQNFAPCLTEIIEEILDKSCLTDASISHVGAANSPQEVCSCTSSQTARWFNERWATLAVDILKKQAYPENPLGSFLNHPLLVSNYRSNMIACTAVAP